MWGPVIQSTFCPSPNMATLKSLSQFSWTFLVLIFFSACVSTQLPQTLENKSQPVGPEIETGSSAVAAQVAATINPYQQQLSEIMSEVLAQVPETMVRDRPEGTLGNWVADLLQEAAVALFPEVDVAFSVQNAGGIRVREIAAGPLEVREIYELMPFDNQLVLVEANGFVVNEFIQHMAGGGGWPVSKELNYVIVDDTATNITIGGVPLELNRNYYFALPDYVANGGSSSSMLKDRPQTDSGKMIRDLLIDYTRSAGGEVRPRLDGRVRKEGE